MVQTTCRFLWRLSILLLLSCSAMAAPPSAPSGLTMAWNNSGVLNGTWTDTSNNEVGFRVYYRTVGTTAWNFFGESVANSSSWTAAPTLWPGLLTFEWIVRAYKGSGVAIEESNPSNIYSVVAPPYMTSARWVSALTGQNFTYSFTTLQSSPVWNVAGLPSGLIFNGVAGISGVPVAHGRYTLDVSLTAGGKTLNTTLRIYVYRPVPALETPVNPVPLQNHTLRLSAAASVNLLAHFSDPDVSDASRLVFNTGTIDYLYYPTAAPLTVANFKGYISRGDYANTIIHRSIPGFVIQGGGYKAAPGTPEITRQPSVVNEPEITNGRATVSMAKSSNSPNSATSEYFISLADNAANLNNQNEGFTVFARIPESGMAVANSIAALQRRNYSTTNPVLSDCPVTNPPPAAFAVDSLVTLLSAGPVAPLSFAVQSSSPGVCGATLTDSSLNLSPLAAGSAVISVTATDLDGQNIERMFRVTVQESMGDWLATRNFSSQEGAMHDADPDGDGIRNIFEYAWIEDPLAATRPLWPSLSVSTAGDQRLALKFPVRKYSGPGFRYTAFGAPSLAGPWAALWSSADGFTHERVSSLEDQADRTVVTVTDSEVVTPGSRRFLRVEVTQQQ